MRRALVLMVLAGCSDPAGDAADQRQAICARWTGCGATHSSNYRALCDPAKKWNERMRMDCLGSVYQAASCNQIKTEDDFYYCATSTNPRAAQCPPIDGSLLATLRQCAAPAVDAGPVPDFYRVGSWREAQAEDVY